ncbi:MAG: hypothetical protein AB7F96_13575 [Beijerinckiaceae bacterium]
MPISAMRVLDPKADIDWVKNAVWAQDSATVICTGKKDKWGRMEFMRGDDFERIWLSTEALENTYSPLYATNTFKPVYSPQLVHMLRHDCKIALNGEITYMKAGECLIREQHSEFKRLSFDDYLANYVPVSSFGCVNAPLYPYCDDHRQWEYD